jgi:hypothetical protein
MSQMWYWSRVTADADDVRNLLQGLSPALPYLRPHGTVPPAAPRPPGLDACAQHLRELGLTWLVVDLTRPEIGVPVARVIAPELRHCWNRLGAGRLYDVPVRMGWLSEPVPEADLNPRLCPI